jgi:integrase
MASKPLTVANVRTARPGDVLRDETIPGLHLRVFSTKAVYYLSYRSPALTKPNGKPVQRRLRLGHGNVLTIPQSRSLAARALLDVANGVDPAVPKRHRAVMKTIDGLFELAMLYHWSAAKYVESGWAKQVRKIYERDIKPTYGTRAAADPCDDVEEWHATFIDRPYLGNRALAILSTILSLGEKAKYGRLRTLNSNPCGAVTKHPEKKRAVYATPEQLSAIGPLLIKYAETRPAAVAFIYLLLFSGSRPSAIERATPDQLTRLSHGGQIWGTLHGFTGKTDDEVVWLPPQAMAVIDSLPKSDTITGIKMPTKFWRGLREEAGCESIRMRDLRRTFATLGMSRGQAMAVISKVLNHKTTQTTDIYAKVYDGEKIGVVGAIADHMEGLLKAG